MLIVIQFPIADMRSFLTDTVQRLPKPDWTGFGDDREFVRCCGGIKERTRGSLGAFNSWSPAQKDWLKTAIPHWTYDTFYCTARNVLKFPELGNSILAQYRPSFAFRRLFSNGNEHVRFEIGVALKPNSELTTADVRKLIKNFMQLPAKAVGTQTSDDLVAQSKKLALIYSKSTLSTKNANNIPQKDLLVVGGEPTIFIEYQASEISCKHNNWHNLDQQNLSGDKLAYFRENDGPRGRKLSVWLLQSGSQTSRNLRLCTLQIHAQREILKKTINFFKFNEYEKLQNARVEGLKLYVAKSKEMLSAKTKFGCEINEIHTLLAEFDQLLTPGSSDLLEEELQKLSERLNIINSGTNRQKINHQGFFDFVNSAFSSVELTTFCFKFFPEVYEKFTAGQTKDQQIRLLIDHANCKRLLHKVAEEIKSENPAIYEEYKYMIFKS
jgi:hypothetical protein